MALTLDDFLATAANATTLTLPTHQVGDLLVFFAFRDGSTTNPTIPAGWTSITSTTDGSTCSVSAGWKIATSSGETSGTWSNATAVACIRIRGPRANLATPIGTFQASSGTTATITYAAVATGGPAFVIAFAGHRSELATLETPPSGMTFLAGATTAPTGGSEVASFVTSKPVDSWPSTTAESGQATGWQTMCIEIKAPSPIPNNYQSVSSISAGIVSVNAGIR